MARVFLGCPTHDGRLDTGACRSLYLTATREHEIVRGFPVIAGGSLLNTNCNELLEQAWNNRQRHGIDWFCMLHSDIDADNGWVDTLIAEAEKHSADLISAISPIKNGEGISSTAISTEVAPHGHAGRLTMRQVNHETFPETFDASMAADALAELPEPFGVPDLPRRGLWLNTACMAFRLDRPWRFKTRANPDGIVFQTLNYFEEEGNCIRHRAVSEDWLFAESIIQQGGRCFATTKVKLNHRGSHNYPNYSAWGSVPNDCEVTSAAVA